MRNILTPISPNLEPDDVRLSLRVLLSPWTWNKQAAVADFIRSLQSLYPNRHIIPTSSGRGALYAVLSNIGLKPEDEVIIQAFTCVTVPAAVKWAGATPVYADIKPHTYNLDPESVKKVITSRTKALIIQHTLGLPADIAALREIARQHNLFVIEDCAHSLGARYHRQPVGSFGDAAILSFGRDKALSGIFGGAVITSHPDLAENITRQQSSLPLPPVWWTAQQLLHPIISSLVIPLYFTSKLGRVILVISQNLGLLSKAVTTAERSGQKPRLTDWRISPALAALSAHQLQKLNRFTTHRQKIAGIYLKHLSPLPALAPTAEPSWLRFPYETKYPRRLHIKARDSHVLLGDWYDAPLAPKTTNAAAFNYRPGSCPAAEKASRRIVNLPTHIAVTSADAHRLIHLIQNHAA